MARWRGSTTRSATRRPVTTTSDDASLSATGRRPSWGRERENRTYYSLNPATRAAALVDQCVIRGFIGTRPTTVGRVLGATALSPPDFTRHLARVRHSNPPRGSRSRTRPTSTRRQKALAGQRHGVVLGHHGGGRDDVQRHCAGGQGDPGTATLDRTPADAGRPAPVQLVRHRHGGRRPCLRRRDRRVGELRGAVEWAAHRWCPGSRVAVDHPPA